MTSDSPSRRTFLKQSLTATAATTVALTRAIEVGAHAAEDGTIDVALVGCGGRGTGAAANALSTKGPARLVAMADVFQARLAGSHDTLKRQFAERTQVPPDQRFVGFDAFKKAIDCLPKNGLVILATPAGFRPIHLEYAVNKGVHVFMEKSFAVDAPGIRRVLHAAEVAKQKNLKIATGLMWRHDKPRQEIIRRLHDGAIGDLILLRTYRMHGAVGFNPRQPGESELAHQIRNYNSFPWLNASFFVDWLIHNIDVCCWAKNDLPIVAQGHGARVARTEPDQMLDDYVVEYTFADGTKLFAQGRHINQTWDIFSDLAHGTKGSAVLMESLSSPKPRLYRGHVQTPENEIWRWSGDPWDPYQAEHDELFEAIRNDKPYNEAERGAKACLVALMGRMAADSGQPVTFEQAMASNLELAPNLDRLQSLDDPAPVQADAQGRYPYPIPGKSQAL
ncbi:MAG: Gfo/Idh/MocA family oxidoreductase [Verrucomicrobiales bacterium]|nr:Gfo/Idh/MocA family oxidoreductase [Verrucomicrobiales bacterium]